MAEKQNQFAGLLDKKPEPLAQQRPGRRVVDVADILAATSIQR